MVPVQAASSGRPAQQRLQVLALLQGAMLCLVQAALPYDPRCMLLPKPGTFLLSAAVRPVQAVQLRGLRGLPIHHGSHPASV